MPPKKKRGTNKSNSEAMRRYRDKIKNDPEAHDRYVQKERERYLRRKAQGKIGNIKQLPEREQRQLRRKWRKYKREQRSKKEQQNHEDIPNTPPPSPNAEEQPGPSQQKKVGRKKMRARDRQAYRTIAKDKTKIKKYQNEIKMLNRKIKRLQSSNQLQQPISDSPASKANSLLVTGDKEKIRKELTFSYALKAEVKSKLIASNKRHRERKVIHAAILGPVLKKYGLLSKAKDEMKLSKRMLRPRYANSSNPIKYSRQTRNHADTVSRRVKEFFIEDVNSTPAAGKKESITRKKDKRQKRYLNDTMQNLYSKFRAQHPDLRLSYTSFTRWRPFFVVTPDVHSRDTVKCKLHANLELKASKLHTLGILKSRNVNDIMSAATCSSENHACMFRQCLVCKNNVQAIYKEETEEKRKSNEAIKFHEWEKAVETRITTKGPLDVNIVKKMEKSTTIASLCQVFEEDLLPLMEHQYRIIHQYKQIRSIKNNLTPEQCVLQIDFSENYSCKAESEIQSMHFGGSRRQITLHTAHATLVDEDGKQFTQCYCTITEDCRHTPYSVWAHLHPVLDDLIANHSVKVLHVVSDGPTSQYKNKTNFQFMALLPFTQYSMRLITWNFLESAHGKGPADGIGAAIKTAADRLVATGTDILGVQDMLENLQSKSNVKLYQIESKAINDMEEMSSKMLGQTVKGTMMIHQLIVPKKGELLHRKLSCFCSNLAESHEICPCFPPVRQVQVQEPKVSNTPVTVQNYPKAPKDKKTGKAVTAIEEKLTEEQVKRFQTRLENGYDVVHADLSALDPSEKEEYVYWKAWRGAKLLAQLNEKQQGSNSDDSDYDNDSFDEEDNTDDSNNDKNDEPSSDEESENDSQHETCDEDPNSPDGASIPIEEGHFYAIFFRIRRTRTFYIGRPTGKEEDNVVEFKFLEKKLVKGAFLYTWPKRDDICLVEKSAVLKKVNFDGPPPFFLDHEKEIRKLAEEYKHV